MAEHHHHHHHHDHHHEGGRSDLQIGLTGLGLGIVWIAIVAAFAHWLAL